MAKRLVEYILNEIRKLEETPSKQTNHNNEVNKKKK